MRVTIVGAGITGLSLAISLAQYCPSLEINIIDERSEPNWNDSELDRRTLALSHGSQQTLQALGVWSDLIAYSTPIEQIDVSDKGHCGGMTIEASDYDCDALGYVVPLIRLMRVLLQHVSNYTKVTFHRTERVEQIVQYQQDVNLQLASGKHVVSQLVVAADGSFSHLATQLHLDYVSQIPQYVAAIAEVELSQPQPFTAFERFTSHGPLALLPLARCRDDIHRYALVWSHPIAMLDHVKSWSDEVFLVHLQSAFGWRLGQFKRVEYRDYFTLHQRYASQLTRHRFVLVGNAAQTLHPVAGQGFNLGLRDVKTLTQSLFNALENQQDIGCFRVLRGYEQMRKKDREEVICMTNGLVSLFSSDCVGFAMARHFGFAALGCLPSLKRRFVVKMLG